MRHYVVPDLPPIRQRSNHDKPDIASAVSMQTNSKCLVDTMTDTKASVVVTGVSSGIGEGIARHCVEQGYRVFGSVRKDADADKLRESLGEAFVPLLFDVRDRPAIEESVQLVSDALNGESLAGLINNAGLALFGPMECLDADVFEEIFAVNVIGTRNITAAFLPLLRPSQNRTAAKRASGSGKIVNISSLSGILNTPMNGAYCVSKHAMESLGEIFRRELKPDGIGVHSIRSGPVQSEIWKKNIEHDQQYDNFHYQLMSDNAQAIMRSAMDDAIPASTIAHLALDIIEGRKRKLSYEVGRGAIASVVLSSWIPTRLADWLIVRAMTKPLKSG